jgi:hypothetical protein
VEKTNMMQLAIGEEYPLEIPEGGIFEIDGDGGLHLVFNLRRQTEKESKELGMLDAVSISTHNVGGVSIMAMVWRFPGTMVETFFNAALYADDRVEKFLACLDSCAEAEVPMLQYVVLDGRRITHLGVKGLRRSAVDAMAATIRKQVGMSVSRHGNEDATNMIMAMYPTRKLYRYGTQYKLRQTHNTNIADRLGFSRDGTVYLGSMVTDRTEGFNHVMTEGDVVVGRLDEYVEFIAADGYEDIIDGKMVVEAAMLKLVVAARMKIEKHPE